MDKDLESIQKKEAMEPIMMDDEQTKEIIRKVGMTCNGWPYQYRMNNKKREVAEREDLDNDKEEIEDIWAMGNIEDILHVTYDRKNIGHGFSTE